ncbi:DEAD/DEAH box helicase [Indioceanicola profundi]|uniref:DEAD/DEAH box helicase n=1 Tax=Indioceanicola profundi TaxID=2220096 RepID=UPI000E6ABB8D|nr:DEAD/DEAH box helicase [Indioceanicola profundi]
MTEFSALGLAAPLMAAVEAEGYKTATPIQAGAIPPGLAGRDVLGLAQTGTGKTAAFALPILQRLAAENVRPKPRHVRTLILTPTRELALQVGEAFEKFGRGLKLSSFVVLGGVGYTPQAKAIAPGLDVLVATPGRLLDLMNQGDINLSQVGIFVLDEADRMLDMGFIHDVKKVVAKLPKPRQNLLFSATMPDAVVSLANGILAADHARVEVTPPSTTVERIEQSVMFVDQTDKPALLTDLFANPAISRAIVFTRTKHGANKVAKKLADAGIAADAIHGNKSQSARERALDGFRAGTVRALVATDIAARGIDIDGVSHVINFDLPDVPEAYVHRIGRTGRAGRDGIAISFCDAIEVPQLRDIEKSIRMAVPVVAEHGYASAEIARLHANGGKGAPKRPAPQGRQPRQQREPRQGGGQQNGQREARSPEQRAGQQNGQPRQGQPGNRPAQAQQGRPQQPRPEQQRNGKPQGQQQNRSQGQKPQGQGKPQGQAKPQGSQPRPQGERRRNDGDGWTSDVPKFLKRA